MKGKSPMMKALIGDQENLNDGLKAAIRNSPATMKKESPAKQGKMSLTYTKTNKKTGETTTNNNKFGTFPKNMLPGNKTPDGNFMKNYKPPIGSADTPRMNEFRPPIGNLEKNAAKKNLKAAVGKMKKESMAKMKKAPAKMKKESMAKMKKESMAKMNKKSSMRLEKIHVNL